MGRLIHTNDLHNAVMMNKSDWGIFGVTIDNLIEGVVSQVSTVEAIPKADYENRLKADMVAMLTEIQLEIEELCIETPLADYEEDMNRGIEMAADAIQKKINALKENKDGSN